MKKFLGFLFTFFGVIVLVWGVLTKLGYIQNYLGIELLCSKTEKLAKERYVSCLKECEEDQKSLKENCQAICTPVAKPVIYLYPLQRGEVDVKVNFDGGFVVTYPKYENGWKVFAYPDGRLINLADGKEYSYLFWEGISGSKINYDLHKGFVVEGRKTALFLQETLSEMGLTPKEYNEFIVYWLPKMLSNKFNLIHFATKEEYEEKVRLEIHPQPDSVLRVFMVFKPLDKEVNILPQEIKPLERIGFTVVEWGGTELQ